MTPHGEPSAPPSGFHGYRQVPAEQTDAAGRRWWDENAQDYLADHAEFLGDADFCWGPEGLRESSAHLLGPVDTLTDGEVLEIGSGAAQCSRWLRSQGVRATASDISGAMLAHSARLDQRTGIDVPTVRADARDLPFVAGSFDVVFSSYGVIPFVADAARVHGEVARVLRPGGRWVFSLTHPIRWAFPDVPGPAGLTVSRSYFDRAPYIETDAAGAVTYAEYHRTLGDHIHDLTTAGFALDDLVEPSWPESNASTWGGWSPLRGAVLPGTAIFVAHRRD